MGAFGRAFILILLLMGCSRQAQETEFSDLYYLIDLNRYEEAMRKNDSLISKYPENEDLRVIKASIYASQAKLSIWDFKEFSLTYSETEDIPKTGESSSSLKLLLERVEKLGINRKDLGAFKKFIKDLEFIEREKNRFSSLPKFSYDQQIYLNQATSYLRGVSLKKKENRLYRVILEMLNLRYELSNKPYFNSSYIMEIRCVEKINIVAVNFVRVFDQLLRIIGDLRQITPGKEKDLSHFKGALEKGKESISQWKREITRDGGLLKQFFLDSNKSGKRCL